MATSLLDFKLQFFNALKQLYEESEVGAIYRLLIEHYLGFDSIEMVQNAKKALDQTDIVRLTDALDRLKRAEPLQYIIGYAYFNNLKFLVKPGILIPRQETEILVYSLCEEIKKNKHKFKILDIGTGSGCIAISLKKNIENCSVTAIDISETALKLAHENAIQNQVDIDLKKVDILNPDDQLTGEKFDVIVSNPPYVLNSEKQLMHRNVVEYEPAEALYVDDHMPLIFYIAAVNFSKKHLTEHGILAFEINEAFGEEIKNLMEKVAFEHVEIIKDLNGKDRVIIGRKS